jgi:cytoskeleton protein RodZ
MSEQEKTYSLGDMLRIGREHANFSQAQVANNLHLTIEVIEKIEQNDFSYAAPIFMLGYIRSYAKLVQISPQHISKAIIDTGLGESNPKAAQSAPHELVQRKKHNRRNSCGQYVLLITILVVIALQWHKNSAVNPPDNTTPTMEHEMEQPLIKQVAPHNDATFAAALPEPSINL